MTATLVNSYWQATSEANWHARERMRATRRRAEAVEQLVCETGLGTVATMLGLSKGRVQQLVATVRESRRS